MPLGTGTRNDQLADHAERAAGEVEGVDRAADVLCGMARGDLEPDARLALGDDRVAQAMDVDAALVDRVDQLLQHDAAAAGDREGRVLAAEDLEATGLEFLLDHGDVV